MAALPLTLAPGGAFARHAATAPQAQLDGEIVSVYGAAGTFGGLTGAVNTPSGDRVHTSAVRGWGFLPGQSAYFPAVARDGTVVIANEPQTDNQLLPTAREMALSTFDPASGRFANVVIPTSTGRRALGGAWPAASGVVGGADVSDVGLVQLGREPRIAFTSAMPFWGWNAAQAGEYPTLGFLRRSAGGAWAADPRASAYAVEIAATTARRARAARKRAAAARQRARAARTNASRAKTVAERARRAVRDLSSSCVARSYPATGRYGDCRMPAEFAQLPSSAGLVVTQYATQSTALPSGRISVLSTSGGVLASYAYPRIALPDGTVLTVHPREVEADPLGQSGDERFVVIFDAEQPVDTASAPSVPGAIQEFRYDAAAGTITPTSAPVLSGDRSGGAPLGFETASYDASGSLWVGQSLVGTLQAGPLAVYRRAEGARGVLGARDGCAVSTSWSGQAWGRSCAPDERIAAAAPLGIARSLNDDPTTDTMLLTTMSGFVLPIRANGSRHLAGKPVDLGLDLLADRTVTRIGPRKAALDPARHLLWIPIQQLATERTCAAWPCTPRALDQWLTSVDVSQLH